CATDYGVVVFDLQNLELRETWRDLGATGGKLKIFQSVFVGDSIFLASQKGVLAGNLNDNLLDFSNWKRYDTGDLSNPVQCIESFNNKIYITINELGIYHRENGSWFKESFLQGSEYSSLHANGLGFLLIVEDQKLWTLNGTNQLNPVADDNLQSPITAIQDETGSFWAGDGQNGLVSNFSGAFESYLPDGPSTNKTFRLKFNDKKIYAVAGGFTSLGMPLGQTGAVNIFENGSWKSLTQTPTDITDIDFMNNSTFTASFGYGLQAETSGTTLLYNENNSPLQNLNPPNKAVYISAVESSSDGLWVANYGATQPLHLLKNSSWQSFSFAFSQARYITDIDVDIFGKAWMTLNPLQGGGILVFDASKNKSTLITDAAGSGALPNKSVRSLAVDRDGYMWAGTDAGVGYFINEDDDIIKPIFENRFLLKDEKITAIAVDGGNRKWIGTEHGVWLFNSTGEELVHNFTQANSPLLSDIVKDIAIHGESGEVFFATDKGIISFRGDAVSGTESFQRIKIFPNPVTAAFNGMVGITGLATDATVKITDINGKLVWQTQANGGSAAWNVRDYNGRRATTGIYLVFAASADGTGSEVGKIAIID
ncbi:MAG: two-component regulator propeller domain-containing protein, partial [Bacteroidota bacterium]